MQLVAMIKLRFCLKVEGLKSKPEKCRVINKWWLFCRGVKAERSGFVEEVALNPNLGSSSEDELLLGKK